MRPGRRLRVDQRHDARRGEERRIGDGGGDDSLILGTEDEERDRDEKHP